MEKISLKAVKIDDMAYEMDIDGHRLIMDADVSVGGKNLGPKPKPLLLAALVGCTGMDMSSILKKMNVNYDSLEIEVETTMATEHPKVYGDMTLIYKLKGEDIPYDKVERAVKLSQERYCGVSAMLCKASNIDYKIILN